MEKGSTSQQIEAEVAKDDQAGTRHGLPWQMGPFLSLCQVHWLGPIQGPKGQHLCS